MKTAFISSFRDRLCKALVRIAGFLLLGILIVGYSIYLLPELRSTSRYVEWHFIIPDTYEGMIAIHYNCPNGTPLNAISRKIEVAFPSNGVYCTSDEDFAWRGPAVHVRSTSGLRIPYLSSVEVYNHTGYAMCCGSVRTIGGDTLVNPGSTLILQLYWVGHMEPRSRTESAIPLNHLDLFLQREFGLRDRREYWITR